MDLLVYAVPSAGLGHLPLPGLHLLSNMAIQYSTIGERDLQKV